MFYTWKELTDWINATLFEVYLFVVALFVYSILLTVKLTILGDSDYQQFDHRFSWWQVHSPLFIFDALSAYFCTIIFIRQYHSGATRDALIRGFFSFKRIFLLFLLKVLLCYKLEGKLLITYSEVFLPLFYLLFILICRSFRHSSA